MASTQFTDGVTLVQSSWLNAVDKATFATLSAVAGTNTVTATGPATLTAYASGDSFEFTPAATNTGATTINITSLGAKNVFWNGAACSGGELVVGVPTRIKYDGTQYNIIGPMIGTRLSNLLSGDVALNNIALFFDGPSVAQGTVGTWFASGQVTLWDTGGAASFNIRLWDGTSAISTGRITSVAASTPVIVTLAGYKTSPAGNIRISVQNVSRTTGVILANATGDARDGSIWVQRVG